MSENKDAMDEELEPLLGDVPESDRKIIQRVIGMSMQQVISPQTALMEKITPEHISEITALQSKDMDLTYKENRNTKIFYGVVLVIVVAVIFGMIILLKDTPELLERILVPIITLIVGSVGGYGYGKSRKDEE